MWLRGTFPLPLLLPLWACSVTDPAREPRPDAPCLDEATEADTPHDRRIRRTLMRGIDALVDGSGTSTIASLREELGRRDTRLALKTPSDVALSTETLHERVLPAVAIVARRYRCEQCTRWHLSAATGFFITTDGACVTSRHVIDREGDDALAVMTADGKVHAVRGVLAASAKEDVVILDVEGEGFSSLPLRPDVATGAPVYVLSHPAGRYWYLTSGLVGRRFVEDHGGGNSTESLDITADFARGSSGAPVLDSTGAAVGVVRATHSVYYEQQDGEQRNLQMVLKRCVPASAVLVLVAE